MQKNNFTIIELVIITVVVILFTCIAIPLQSRANSTATEMSCESSLKQIMTACVLYQADHDGFYPFATAGDGKQPDVWLGVIQAKTMTAYVSKALSLWGCPDNKSPKKAFGGTYYYNYAYNFWAFAKGMQLKNNNGFKNSMFKGQKNASNTVVFQDGANSRNAPGIIHWSEQFMNPEVKKSSASIAHDGGKFVNAGFADGHVGKLNAPEHTWNDRRKNGAFFKEIFPDAAFCYHTNYK